MAYYRLGFQDPTDSSILDVLGQFIADNGIPRPLITDSHSILGAGKKRKQIPGRKSILLFLSEPDKHNKNPIERSIQNLKARVGKIGNDFKTGLLEYEYDMIEYLCNFNNYFSRASLNNCLP